MVTVALVGPDGSGKTTIGRRLVQALPMPVKYIYMGVNADASNYMLPTTRLIHFVKRKLGAKPDTHGPRDPNQTKKRPKSAVKRVLGNVKSSINLVNRLTEEWYRQGVAWYFQKRGYIILFDRHFFSDYYSYDIANSSTERTFSQRVHGFVLKHLYPKPSLLIYLDAPAEVLFARKGEGTIAVLEERRKAYMQMRELVPHFAVLDATQPEAVVTQNAVAVIKEHYQRSMGRKQRSSVVQVGE
jgi:thymidylate kinase